MCSGGDVTPCIPRTEGRSECPDSPPFSGWEAPGSPPSQGDQQRPPRVFMAAATSCGIGAHMVFFAAGCLMHWCRDVGESCLHVTRGSPETGGRWCSAGKWQSTRILKSCPFRDLGGFLDAPTASEQRPCPTCKDPAWGFPKPSWESVPDVTTLFPLKPDSFSPFNCVSYLGLPCFCIEMSKSTTRC